MRKKTCLALLAALSAALRVPAPTAAVPHPFARDEDALRLEEAVERLAARCGSGADGEAAGWEEAAAACLADPGAQGCAAGCAAAAAPLQGAFRLLRGVWETESVTTPTTAESAAPERREQTQRRLQAGDPRLVDVGA
eukprot:COSAG04_NODE_12661_length_641_cov_1.215867_1_plen_137_part_01